MTKFSEWLANIGGRSPLAAQPGSVPADQPGSSEPAGEPTVIFRPRLGTKQVKGKNLRNHLFKDLNGAGTTYENCNFSYSIFERAYFHAATFKNCDFTGCRFYDCNFRMASLYNCQLRYCLLYSTLVEVDEFIANLPFEPNLRRDLLQNLRTNAASIGDTSAQKVFVLAEIEAKEDHLRRAIFGSDAYYREKYGRIRDKAQALGGLVWLKIGGFVWGHGEKAGRIFLSAFAWVLLLSLVNFWAVLPRVHWTDTNHGILIFKYCFDLFIDMNPDVKFRGFMSVDYALMFMRYVYIGLFVSVAFKGISHR